METLFKPSELIVTSKGRIAHLNLHPDEIADTIITVGDPGRVALVSQYFDSIEVKVQNREFITHTGYLNRKRLSVISTGIGTPNIDIVVNELDALVNIDFASRTRKKALTSLAMIRFGTAGSINSKLTIGDYVLTTHAIGLDGLLHYYQRPVLPEELAIEAALVNAFMLKPLPTMPYVVSAAANLVQQFTPVTTAAGITVTCGGFYGPQNRLLRAPIAYPDLLAKISGLTLASIPVLNFEMETAALLGLASMLGHRSASISMIIANRIKGEFCDTPAQSIDKFIATMLQTLVA